MAPPGIICHLALQSLRTLDIVQRSPGGWNKESATALMRLRSNFEAFFRLQGARRSMWIPRILNFASLTAVGRRTSKSYYILP
jgi:hypothetical protein